MTEPSLDEFLVSYPPEIHDLVYQARELIFRVIPGAIEIVDPPSRIIAYGLGRKYADLICAISPYKGYINLMFSKGVELDDPEKLLEGTGKRARHLKIRKAEDLQAPGAQALLEDAFRRARPNTA